MILEQLSSSVGERGRRAGGAEVVRTKCLVSTLHPPRSFVLAALLVVVAGARVARAPLRSEAAGALAADAATWTLHGRGSGDHPGGYWDAMCYGVAETGVLESHVGAAAVAGGSVVCRCGGVCGDQGG